MLWPSDKEIARDVAADFSVVPLNIVPGFKAIRVAGIEVGEWKTGDDLFGDGSQEVIAAEWASADLRHMNRLFRTADLKRRYEDFMTAKKTVIVECPKDNPEKRIENIIAKRLRREGGEVHQQVRIGSDIIDIVDHTTKLLVECKAGSHKTFVVRALEQLFTYSRHFPDYTLALGLPELIEEKWLADLVHRAGVKILTARPVFDGTRAAA